MQCCILPVSDQYFNFEMRQTVSVMINLHCKRNYCSRNSYYLCLDVTEIVSSPEPGCGRWAAGWTGGGPEVLGSYSRDRPPERRCPAASPPRSDTGSRAEAGWSPVHFRRDP